jgi:hypothetical protein
VLAAADAATMALTKSRRRMVVIALPSNLDWQSSNKLPQLRHVELRACDADFILSLG